MVMAPNGHLSIRAPQRVQSSGSNRNNFIVVSSDQIYFRSASSFANWSAFSAAVPASTTGCPCLRRKRCAQPGSESRLHQNGSGSGLEDHQRLPRAPVGLSSLCSDARMEVSETQISLSTVNPGKDNASGKSGSRFQKSCFNVICSSSASSMADTQAQCGICKCSANGPVQSGPYRHLWSGARRESDLRRPKISIP